MYERFTDQARKVMYLANQEAQRFNHEYIDTEHILLGLVKEGSGVAANALKNLDVDVRKIRIEVEKIVPSGPDIVTMGKLSQAPGVKMLIKYATEEARNHIHVGTDHLLLGLLREQQGVAAHVLVNLGLKLDDIREEVLDLRVRRMEEGESNAGERPTVTNGGKSSKSKPPALDIVSGHNDRRSSIADFTLGPALNILSGHNDGDLSHFSTRRQKSGLNSQRILKTTDGPLFDSLHFRGFPYLSDIRFNEVSVQRKRMIFLVSSVTTTDDAETAIRKMLTTEEYNRDNEAYSALVEVLSPEHRIFRILQFRNSIHFEFCKILSKMLHCDCSSVFDDSPSGGQPTPPKSDLYCWTKGAYSIALENSQSFSDSQVERYFKRCGECGGIGEVDKWTDYGNPNRMRYEKVRGSCWRCSGSGLIRKSILDRTLDAIKLLYGKLTKG